MTGSQANLEQLLDDHREIDNRSSDIIRMTETIPVDMPRIETALQELNDLMIDHLRREDVVVYDVAARLRATGQQQQEADMTAELNRLKAEWDHYIHAWPPGTVPAALLRFRQDTRAMLSKIQERVRIESELLYFTALRHGLIALRGGEDGIRVQ